MTRWRTHKHFTSWMTLAPRNKVSGDRLISSKTQPSANRAAVLLRMCAMVLGKPKAITATARKLAILVYCTLKGDMNYKDPGAQAYDEQHRARTLQNLRNRARQLGFGLVSVDTGELLQEPVS